MKAFSARAVVLFLLLCAVPPGAFGAAGDLDAAYSPPNPFQYVFCAAVQADTKMIIGGDFTYLSGTARGRIARLSSSGALDAGFDPNANNTVRCVAVQPDGRILVGGTFTSIAGASRNWLARLNADGTLDATFANTGVSGTGNISDGVSAMAIQSDGKILISGMFTTVGGVTRNNIARLNSDGTLDTGFNPNANGMVTCMVVRTDGSIVTGGYFTQVAGASSGNPFGGGLAILNSSGTISRIYNVSDAIWSLALQSDGKVVFGGFLKTIDSVARNRMGRLNADGTLDSAFSPAINLTAYSEGVSWVALQANGQIIVTGSFTSVGGVTRNHAARLNSDGTLDVAFNPNLGNTCSGGTIQADGKIVFLYPGTINGGSTGYWFARVLNDATTESLTAASASRVQWLRGGAAPEAAYVTFDLSTDGGTTWSSLGYGSRISGGWEKTGLSLPGSGRIRARAQLFSGNHGESLGLVETVQIYDFPPTLTSVTMASNNAGPALAKAGDVVTLSFTASEAIQTPTVTLAGRAATMTNPSGNNWTGTITVSAGDTQGAAALSVVFKDLANTSGTTVTAVTSGSAVNIDTVAPAAPSTPAMTSATDTGIAGDGITSNTTPVFTGTAEAGATVKLYDTDGTTVLGTGTATAGNYSIASSALGVGSHTITAVATDAAGNVSPTSAGSTAVILTATPAAPSTPDLAAASDLGFSNTDNITKATTPTFTGTAPAGTTVTLYDTNGTTVLGTGSVTSGAWSIATTTLGTGNHTVTAKASDVAANVSAASGGLTVTIDTTAPTLSPVTIASNNGVGGATRARTGDTITLSFTSSETIQTPSVTLAGRAATMSNPSGNNWTASITVTPGDPQGTAAFSITATDIAGNVATRTTTTNASSVTVDTGIPVAPSTPVLAAASDTGVSNSDRITNLTVLTITGTAEAGATVKLFSNINGQVGSATATGGSWSIAASPLSPNNTHSFTATATDAAGNTGPSSAALTVTIDTTAATLVPVTIASSNANPALARAGDVVTVSISSSETIQAPSVTLLGRAATVSGAGLNWTASVTVAPGDPQGAAAFSITATDLAGNAATRTTTTNSSSVSVDTVAPAVAAHANVGPIEATGAAGVVVTYAAGSATDAGTPSPVITYSQNSGTTFPIGVTTVTISAKDAANNTGTGTFTVTVQDTTAPVVAAHANVGPIEATGAAGAVVTYAAGSATDAVTASPVIAYSQDSGTTFPIGVTTVTISAKDAASNTGTGTFTVTVQDTTAPVVTPPANVSVHATSPSGAAVSYSSASAADAVGVVSLTYSQASGSTFPVGTTTVTVTAKDAANNAGTATFTVTVTPLTTAENWRYAKFGTAANTGNTADNGDFDNDGIVNLLEFAFGTDPTSNTNGVSVLQYTGTFAGGGAIAATGQPITMLEPTANGVDFRALFVRRKDYAAAGLTYTPQFSATLATWVNSAAVPTVLADDGTHQIVSVPYPPFVGGKKARFFRISVSIAP